MTCEAARPAPFRCPSLLERIAATLALLPRGRAWGSDAGAPAAFHDAAFDPAVFDPEIFDTKSKPGTIIFRFWSAVAEFFYFIETRLCDLRLEFWCATMSETRDLWFAEYGLPDDCDPFPDLCDKVAAIGGARCEYFNERIARKGWRAECFDGSLKCGMRFGGARFGASKATFGGKSTLSLTVRVHTGDPADGPSIISNYRSPRFGRYRFGQRPSCDTVTQPSIAHVRCLMERIAPAHVLVEYVY